MKSLDEYSADEGYDQFKGRNSTYNFNTYTTTLDEKKITKEQKEVAERIEKELAEGPMHAEDMETDNDAKKYSDVGRQNDDAMSQFKMSLM